MYQVPQKDLALDIRLRPGRAFPHAVTSGKTVSELLEELYLDGRMSYRPNEVKVWVNDEAVMGSFSIQEDAVVKIQRNMDGGSR